jgi:translocation and assembly module TamB
VALTDAVIGNLRAPRTTGILRYADRRLTGELELRRAGVTVLEVHTSLPLDLSFTEVERRRLRGPISVRAVADSIDLSLLGAVTPYVRRAQGTLDADFGIGGTWEDPELTGRIAIRDGEAAFPALGVRHEDVNGTLVLSGDEIRVEQLTVRSGRGTARVTGAVRLEEISRPLLNLRIIARDFRALDIRGFLSLTGSGDLSLRGPVFGAMLTGRGTANRGVLYFADLITKEIVDLEDTLFEGLVDTTLLREEGLGSEFENRFLDSLRISNLELALGDDVWMRSTEANIQLRGAVTVGKEGDRYLINGTLETPRGTYRLDLAPTVTREFRVTRGQVRYFGTPDLNADLDIDAEHIVRAQRRENVTINVHIGGTLYEPRLRLTSNITPPISDAEIVSYLLFGAENVGTRESQQASEFVSERLYGVLSGQLESTFISDIGIPLDYLQIRPMARGGFFGGTTIDIGKQFNVFGTTAFLTASPLICPRQSSAVDLGASLEFRLSRRWLVAASVDPHRRCESFAAETTTRYQFGLDLFWETSY